MAEIGPELLSNGDFSRGDEGWKLESERPPLTVDRVLTDIVTTLAANGISEPRATFLAKRILFCDVIPIVDLGVLRKWVDDRAANPQSSHPE